MCIRDREDPLAVVTPDPVIKPETFEELPGEIKQFSSEEKLQDKIKQEIFKQELPDDQLSHKVHCLADLDFYC